MHFSNLVIIEKPQNGELKKLVEKAMGPHEDSGGFWDWWQIGGRWTGIFDGYKPEDDPRNIKTCWLCNGTGTRKDMVVADGCNGCAGTGKMVEWPTNFTEHPGDVIPVKDLPEDILSKIHRIVVSGYPPWGGEDYLPWKKEIDDKFVKREMPPIEWLKKKYEGMYAVIVDNHS